MALDAGLKVMFAMVGEKKKERENGVTMEICAS